MSIFSWLQIPQYTAANDLCVITSYYNPHRFRTKKANYLLFESTMRQASVPLYSIQCLSAFHSLNQSDDGFTMTVRAESVLWHKERLLNILLPALPRQFTKVAWVDGDLLFSNPSWAIETSHLLEYYPIVQPFDTAIRLPRGHTRYTGEGAIWRSFASIWQDSTIQNRSGWSNHGHTGFAWAARRDFLDMHGLYDANMGGSGDHVMAHAFCDEASDPCVTQRLGNGAQFQHFRKWALPVGLVIQGQIGCAKGSVLHLWHGDPARRAYDKRHSDLIDMRFDPNLHLTRNCDDCWEWSGSMAPTLQQWSTQYFQERREDDGPSS